MVAATAAFRGRERVSKLERENFQRATSLLGRMLRHSPGRERKREQKRVREIESYDF